MTRVNLVCPTELTVKHLVAEYREITRVFGLVRRAQAAGRTPATCKIPAVYTMGAGHVTFFYDKLTFVAARYCMLINEMQRRGYKPTPVYMHELVEGLHDHWMGCWEPTDGEVAVSRARILERTKS